MFPIRKSIVVVSLSAAALSLLVAASAHGAAPRASLSSPPDSSRAYLNNYNLPSHGVALEGYSPVSYFEMGNAERGNALFSVLHEGVTYHLTSARQVETFKRNLGMSSPFPRVPDYSRIESH